MNMIFEYFDKILPITKVEIEEATPFLRTKVLKKDEFLLSEGQICNTLIFIKSGSFRSFHVNSNGNSAIIMLSSMNEFISDYHSFITEEPSNISIQSIDRSEVIFIYKSDLDNLLKNSFYWNKLGRLMTEGIFVESKLRLESMMYKTPEERYLDIVNHSPDFLDNYSLTDIANFIGVTLQSLSRIRARLFKLP